MGIKGECPICDANIMMEENLVVSEILSCPHCHSLLVVESVEDHRVILNQAPKIEEDWGE